jgi:catechol 2,3-dioxygenase-like lactoylglutathione lyase family enzyme
MLLVGAGGVDRHDSRAPPTEPEHSMSDQQAAVHPRLHHIGAFVEDWESAVEFQRTAFGAELLAERWIEDALRIAFMRLPTHELHLLSRERRGLPAAAIRDELEPYRYHVAYEVDDVRAAIAAVEAAGCEMIVSEPNRAGLRPWERAFSHPEGTPGPPFELLERVGEEPPEFR